MLPAVATNPSPPTVNLAASELFLTSKAVAEVSLPNLATIFLSASVLSIIKSRVVHLMYI